jgi:hypothetical protein
MPAKYLKASVRPKLYPEGMGSGCPHALARYEEVGKGHRKQTVAYAKPCKVKVTMHMQEKAAGKKPTHRDAYGREWQ